MILLCELRSDDPARKRLRERVARELDFYRRYRQGTKNPKLHGMDGCYTAETPDGPVTIYAVFDEENRRGGPFWRVTCEVTSGGSYWEPPDTDEVVIVEAARSIGEALLLTRHAVELRNEQECQRAFRETHSREDQEF